VAAVLLIVPSLAAAPTTYQAVDRSGDRTAARWLERILPQLEPGAVVLSWWSFSTPLWYAQLVEGARPDIVIVDDRVRGDEDLGSITDVIDANLGRAPVYILRESLSAIPDLAERYEIEKLETENLGMLIHVLGHRIAS
jgi:hypothetical protein